LDEPLRARWAKLAGVGMIVRQRDVNGTLSIARAFYSGSLGITNAETFAKTAGSHRANQAGTHKTAGW